MTMWGGGGSQKVGSLRCDSRACGFVRLGTRGASLQHSQGASKWRGDVVFWRSPLMATHVSQPLRGRLGKWKRGTPHSRPHVGGDLAASSHLRVATSSTETLFVAFCSDVRTLTFCQLAGFPSSHSKLVPFRRGAESNRNPRLAGTSPSLGQERPRTPIDVLLQQSDLYSQSCPTASNRFRVFTSFGFARSPAPCRTLGAAWIASCRLLPCTLPQKPATVTENNSNLAI